MKKCWKNCIVAVLAVMAFMPTSLLIRMLVPVTVVILYAIYKIIIEVYNYFRLKRIIFKRNAENVAKTRRQQTVDTCNAIYENLGEE